MNIAARDEHFHKAFQGNGCFCSGDSSIGVKEVGGFPSFHPKRAWRKFSPCPFGVKGREATNLFDPDGAVTRAEAAVALERFVKVFISSGNVHVR